MVEVSLVIAFYNSDRYLEQAIASILAQTYTDFELILVDDGSTDNSLALARKFAKRDRRITILEKTHQGHTKCWSDAIALSSGKYISWVDSDDWITPECLQKTYCVLEGNSKIGVVYTDYFDVDENGKTQLGYRTFIPYSPQRMLVDLMSYHFRLIRRTAYDAVGGLDENFKFNQDFDLCLKLSETTGFYHLREPLYYKRTHSNSVTCLHRSEQIEYSKLAIENALIRRGLKERSHLAVCPTSGRVQLLIEQRNVNKNT